MEAMPLRDMLFWFFLTIFGTGTFVILEKHIVWGTALIGVGLAGMVGCAWPYIRSQLVVAHYLNSRPLLIAVFLILSLSLLLAMATPDLHQRLQGWLGFAAVGLVGAVVACGYWWLTGRMLSPAPVAATSGSSDYSADSSVSSDDDSQYQLLNLSPQQKAELDKLKAPLFRYKATVLDTPLYYKYKVAKGEYRTMVENVEKQHGCLIDVDKLECLPKPPSTITENKVDIDISVKMVAEEISKTFFWVIRNKSSKVRVPIALFVSLTNRQATPLKIDLLYLDAKSVDGWADIRMVDSFFPNNLVSMSEKPLVLQAKNASTSMKGEYLLPSLYDRVIQPGDKAEGWVISEFPKGFKYGSSIGDMRISLLAGNHWIASKTFPANPRVFKDHPLGDWYFTPLDTLITEEW